MKKLIMVIVTLTALYGTAQDRKHKEEVFKDLTPEEIATIKTKQMTLHLDLSEAQQSQIKDIMLEEAEHKARLRKEREDKAENKPSKEERFAMMNDRLDRKIEMKKKMKTILNDDQYKKWEKAIENKDKRHPRKRPKR